MKNPITRFLSWCDRLLCLRSPVCFRVWWSRLWIRKNEFHPSLDIDVEYARRLKGEGVEKYWRDVLRRREIAHRRDLQTP